MPLSTGQLELHSGSVESGHSSPSSSRSVSGSSSETAQGSRRPLSHYRLTVHADEWLRVDGDSRRDRRQKVAALLTMAVIVVCCAAFVVFQAAAGRVADSVASTVTFVLLVLSVGCLGALGRSKDVRWAVTFAHAMSFIVVVVLPLMALVTVGLSILDVSGKPHSYLMLSAPFTLAITSCSMQEPRWTVAYAAVAGAYTIVGAVWSPVGADLTGTGSFALMTLCGLVIVVATSVWNSDQVGSFSDEVTVVSAQAKVARAEARLERHAHESKSRFVSVMSHEIKNPLQAILLQVELLETTKLTERQASYVSGIRTASTSMHSIVRDVLEVGKMEAGALRVDAVRMSLRTVVEEAVRSRALAASRAGVELVCYVPPDLPTDIVGDPMRIRQVVDNLVANALRFTPSGEIEVSLSLDETPLSVSRRTALSWRLSVRDTGIGISAKGLSKLFVEFSQVSDAPSHSHGGTGLGLFICKELATLMGGSIVAQSQPGVGSTFSLLLTAEPAPAQPSTAETIPRMLLSPQSGVSWATIVYATNATLRRALSEYASSYFAGVTSADVIVADRPSLVEVQLRTLLQSRTPTCRVLVVANRDDCTGSLLSLLSSAACDDVVPILVHDAMASSALSDQNWPFLVEKPVSLLHLATTMQRATRASARPARRGSPSPWQDAATDTSSSMCESAGRTVRDLPAIIISQGARTIDPSHPYPVPDVRATVNIFDKTHESADGSTASQHREILVAELPVQRADAPSTRRPPRRRPKRRARSSRQ